MVLVDTIRHIPLSASLITKKTEVLTEEMYKTLKQTLVARDCYTLALDVSCNIEGTARLIICVCYLYRTDEQIFEELLNH